ncbi:hypothetical protein ABPG74_007149 [Tetrahymena malaccensis]
MADKNNNQKIDCDEVNQYDLKDQEDDLNINKKRKFDELYEEQESQTQELKSISEIQDDIPTKKPKSNKKDKIEGPFHMKGFQWFEKNGQRYLKIIKNEIKNINVNCFSENISQSSDMGKQIHRLIKKYIDTQNESVLNEYEFLDQEEKNYIQYQIDQTIQYLKLRGMDKFYTEKLLKNSQSNNKYIDLLAVNTQNKQCIIVDWKFQNKTQQHIIKYGDFHYIQQINAAMNEFQDYNVTILIVPLKNIRNLKFIEFTKQEVEFLQKDQLLSNTYQNQKKYLLEQKFKDNIHLNLSTLDQNYSHLTIQEYAQHLYQSGDTQKIDFFKNLDNSLKYRDESDISISKYISKLDQFFIINNLLKQQASKIILINQNS